MLEAGDYVPADGRILENASLKVDESALTGESLSVEKMEDAIEEKFLLETGPIWSFQKLCFLRKRFLPGNRHRYEHRSGQDRQSVKEYF